MFFIQQYVFGVFNIAILSQALNQVKHCSKKSVNLNLQNLELFLHAIKPKIFSFTVIAQWHD